MKGYSNLICCIIWLPLDMDLQKKDAYQAHIITYGGRNWEVLDSKIVAIISLNFKKGNNLYLFKKSELEEALGKKITTKQIMESAERLTKAIKIKEDDESWVFKNIFEEFAYKRGQVSIKLTDFGEDAFIDLKQFTAYDLDALIQFKSKFTPFLFQVVQSWKKRGQTPKIDLEELRVWMNAEGKRYDKFAVFRRVIDGSLEEINEGINLNATYTLFKTGRKFTHIQFQFNKYQQKENSAELQTALDQQADNPHAYAQSLKSKQKEETIYTPPQTENSKPSQADFTNNQLRHMEILKPMIDEGQSFDVVQAAARERYKFNFTEEMWGYLVG